MTKSLIAALLGATFESTALAQTIVAGTYAAESGRRRRTAS